MSGVPPFVPRSRSPFSTVPLARHPSPLDRLTAPAVILRKHPPEHRLSVATQDFFRNPLVGDALAGLERRHASTGAGSASVVSAISRATSTMSRFAL